MKIIVIFFNFLIVKNILLIIFFFSTVSVGQTISNRLPGEISDDDYRITTDPVNNRFKFLDRSGYVDIMLDRQSGTLFTNNNRQVRYSGYNEGYINFVRRNCEDGKWCQLAQKKYNSFTERQDDGTLLTFTEVVPISNIYDVFFNEQYGYILVNTRTSQTFVSNFSSWTYNSKETVFRENGGRWPYILKKIIECPKGYWCELNKPLFND